MTFEDPGRGFLFNVMDKDNQVQFDVSSSVCEFVFKENKIALTFLATKVMFTWLDKFRDQRDTLSIKLIDRTGETLQVINFFKVKLDQKMLDLHIGHNVTEVLRLTIDMTFEKFDFEPTVPNEDIRYLFKKYLEKRGINAKI